MNLKALRRPHEHGRNTQLHVTARSRCQPAQARAVQDARPIGRWSVAANGRLELAWELAPERPARRPINRKRGSDA